MGFSNSFARYDSPRKLPANMNKLVEFKRAKKSLGYWCCVLMGSALLSVLAAELVMRSFAPYFTMGSYIEEHSELGYTLKKNARSQYFWRGVFTSLRTNSQGLRQDDDVSPIKAPNEFRLLALGDSFTFGWGVDVEQTYLHLLKLRAQRAMQHKKVTFLNAGFGGYGTQEMLAYLQYYGFDFDPDYVVVFMGPNDIYDNVRSDLYKISDDGTLIRNLNPKKNKILHDSLAVGWLRFHSVLYQIYRTPILNLMVPIRKQVSSWLRPENRPSKDILEKNVHRTRLTQSLLLKMKNLCNEQGIPFTVATVGIEHPTLRRFFKNSKKWFAEAGIDFIRVKAIVLEERSRQGNQLIIADDEHYNPQGHKVFTKYFWPHLYQRLIKLTEAKS